MNYEQFIEELKEFCTARGYEIAGTCYNEGIYGEITVHRIGYEHSWNNWDERKFNFEQGWYGEP
jgi:hypothetical protein